MHVGADDWRNEPVLSAEPVSQTGDVLDPPSPSEEIVRFLESANSESPIKASVDANSDAYRTS